MRHSKGLADVVHPDRGRWPRDPLPRPRRRRCRGGLDRAGPRRHRPAPVRAAHPGAAGGDRRGGDGTTTRAGSTRARSSSTRSSITSAPPWAWATRPGQPAGRRHAARSAVTHRIRATIRQLEKVNPNLGRHLRHAINTGTYCSYRPERPTPWRIGAVSCPRGACSPCDRCGCSPSWRGCRPCGSSWRDARH